MSVVVLQCMNGHDYTILFDEPKRPECDHDTSDKVRGTCIQCAMQAPQKDPSPYCPECHALPARILEQPPVKIKILKG